MTSVEFLDAVRARHSIPSDVQLAKFLKIDHSRVSLYRTGRRRLDPNACIKVAAALDLPAEHVFAAVQAERAKRTEHRRIWERLAKLARHAGAAVVLAYAATSPQPAPAAVSSAGAQDCIFCQTRRRWWWQRPLSAAPPGARTWTSPAPSPLERRHHDRRRSARPLELVA